ncbi:hypothetical protein FMEAI12_6390004 [Parafrankia sp. Ea1.12]|nr:hypothetical protein FMEAI12_6390004 [Parafrankia sp. Ea1.12]
MKSRVSDGDLTLIICGVRGDVSDQSQITVRSVSDHRQVASGRLFAAPTWVWTSVRSPSDGLWRP